MSNNSELLDCGGGGGGGLTPYRRRSRSNSNRTLTPKSRRSRSKSNRSDSPRSQRSRSNRTATPHRNQRSSSNTSRNNMPQNLVNSLAERTNVTPVTLYRRQTRVTQMRHQRSRSNPGHTISPDGNCTPDLTPLRRRTRSYGTRSTTPRYRRSRSSSARRRRQRSNCTTHTPRRRRSRSYTPSSSPPRPRPRTDSTLSDSTRSKSTVSISPSRRRETPPNYRARRSPSNSSKLNTILREIRLLRRSNQRRLRCSHQSRAEPHARTRSRSRSSHARRTSTPEINNTTNNATADNGNLMTLFIPEFDPNDTDQTITTWLNKVNECAYIAGWDSKQTAAYALSKLLGTAKRWYQRQSPNTHSWEEWQEKLKTSFPVRENYALLLGEMMEIKAKYGDDLEDYYFDKLRALNRCRIFGRDAVDCIVYGIEDSCVREGVVKVGFDDVDRLLAYLRRVTNQSMQAMECTSFVE